MAYRRSHFAGPPMPANRPVQTSANWWRGLQKYNASLGRMGCSCPPTVTLSGGRRLGDDGDDSGFSDDLSDLGGSSSIEGNDLGLADLGISSGGLNSLSSSELSDIEPTQYTLPDSSSVLTSPTSSLSTSLVNSLVNSTAQIASAATGSTTTTAATSSSLIPGISNTALLVGGLVVLMVAASAGGKRR